jgi:hypothetical protein
MPKPKPIKYDRVETRLLGEVEGVAVINDLLHAHRKAIESGKMFK